tara:strand:- start:2910 stop:3596 length:687 start_codon:yes stop_codon:yes gene_type:complete
MNNTKLKKNVNKNNVKMNNTKRSQVTLGIKVEDDASHREVIDNLKKNLKKNNDKVKTFKSKVNDLKKFNNKLSDGYQLSLQMIVDVSDLLHRYVQVFDMMETMMKDIEATFEFSDEDFQYIRNLTEKSILDLQSKMHSQIDSMVVVFEKEGLKKQAAEIKKFKEVSFEISNNASRISKTKTKSNTNAKSNAKLNTSKKNSANTNSTNKNSSKKNNSKKTSIFSKFMYD